MGDETSNVIEMRDHILNKNISHVMFSADADRQAYTCSVCGVLPVIDGVVIHTRSDEDHG